MICEGKAVISGPFPERSLERDFDPETARRPRSLVNAIVSTSTAEVLL
jgi:hypothetical protein